jgi:hypothetical protein
MAVGFHPVSMRQCCGLQENFGSFSNVIIIVVAHLLDFGSTKTSLPLKMTVYTAEVQTVHG